jgi:hypothetical protein
MYGGLMRKSFFQRIISAIGAVFSPEKLDDLPEIHVERERVSFFSWLLKHETLPLADEAKGSGGKSFFSWLFAHEALPMNSPAVGASARPSFLAVLFSRERLPDEPPPGPVPGNSGSEG